jgi:hypothetical protein
MFPKPHMKNKILVMVPHLSAEGKRIKQLNDLILSWRDTTSGYSDFLIGMDEDDLQYHTENFANDIIVDINPKKLNVVEKINHLSSKYGKDYGYIYFVGNDCVFRTKDWEKIFLGRVDGKKLAMLYADDTKNGSFLATHIFMSMNIINDLGFMGPPFLHHMYVDNFWMMLGAYLGCIKYVPEVILEHLHYSDGKSEKDFVYDLGEKYYNSDQVPFRNYMNVQFFEDLKKVKQ